MSTKFCHFVQAHHDDETVRQLVRLLRHPEDKTLVHCDPTAEDGAFEWRIRQTFEEQFHSQDGEVEVMRGETSTYASWPQVYAVLRGMKHALKWWPDWTHFIALCGATMPLFNRAHRAAQFEAGYTYMNYATKEEWAQFIVPRTSNVWGYDELTKQWFDQGIRMVGDPEGHLSRMMGRKMELFGQCPAYSAFAREDCEYLVSPDCAPVRSFCHHVHCVDEIFFATALMNYRPRFIRKRGIMECQWRGGKMACEVQTPEMMFDTFRKALSPTGPLFVRKCPVGPVADMVLARLRESEAE